MRQENSTRSPLREEVAYQGVVTDGTKEIKISYFRFSWNEFCFPIVITFEGLVAPDQNFNIRDLLKNHILKFSGKDENQQSVEAVLFPTRVALEIFSGKVNDLVFGIPQLSSEPKFQKVVISFTPTPIAIPEILFPIHKSTGEISAFAESDRRPPFEMQTPIGIGNFSLQFKNKTTFIGEIKTNAQVPIPILEIDVSEEHRSSKPKEIEQRLLEWLSNFESILSFLGRRQTRKYQIKIISEFSVGDGKWETYKHFSRGVSSPATERFVDARRMDPAVLNTVCLELERSPYKDAIKFAIDSLNAYWNSNFVESTTTFVFTAFETIIASIGDHTKTSKIISNKLFEKLETELKKIIETFSLQNTLTVLQKGKLLKKITELKRSPIKDLAFEIFSAHQINTSDLWPVGTTFEEGLRVAYESRNIFLHTGKFDDSLISDSNRLHALTERLIFKLLNCDSKWIDRSSYEYTQQTLLGESNDDLKIS